ncbi:probable replication factor C subunit 1 [Mya arenaria]|uniref:probable replication factor C subunit 1 n=1 Tax=Mya arenaria TaxID=6604 RepID=UPI0022E8CCC3|nr:probable replication factor C subunit 1 [Mya arenaria]
MGDEEVKGDGRKRSERPILLFLACLLPLVHADYPCVCNYNVEAGVYDQQSTSGQPIGYLYEFDCKPETEASDNDNFIQIMFEHKLGYLEKNDQVQSQVCPGQIPPTDLVATTTTAPVVTTTTMRTTSTTTRAQTTATTSTTTRPISTTTTPKPVTSTTTRSSTSTSTTTTPTTTTTTPTTTRPSLTLTPSSRPTTTTSTTTMRSSTEHTTTTTSKPATSVLVEGHIELCPDHVRNDLSIFKGFLGQYGDYCFELVDVKTQWHNAQRHCTVAGNGFLTHVTNQQEQDYFLRFLSNHTYVESIWLGLTDSEQEGATAEGKWTWISGDPVTFTKFGPDFNTQTANDHKLHDCVIMKNGGEWTDVPCGVSLLVGTGFGESHPFICQYNVTSKPPNLFNHLTDAIIG